jgi:hypothetical protein
MLPGLVNVTPFTVDVSTYVDADARQYHVFVLSASFEARPGEHLRVADQQLPVVDADMHFGVPGESSVKYDSDLVPAKPFFDVIVNGAAYAPEGRPTTEVEVGIRVGAFRKVLLVSGDRKWQRLGTPSAPEPFVRLPIVYERAFGGCQGDKCDRRNPVGVGFEGAVSRDPGILTEVPNVESLVDRVRSRKQSPKLAGFGVVARAWLPRLPLAGTYDERWKAEQFPLVARDLDDRFYQSSPSDQQFERSFEGEMVQAVNMTPEGLWSSRVPRLTVPVRARCDKRTLHVDLRTDTLIVEPDAYRIALKARACVAVCRNSAPVEEFVVGEASRAWWRARMTGKEYIGRASDGAGGYFAV